MHITVKTRYDIQYITMRISGYTNAPKEPYFIDIKHGMKYIMQNLHEPIMYSRNNIYKNDKIPHQYYVKAGYAEINKN